MFGYLVSRITAYDLSQEFLGCALEITTHLDPEVVPETRRSDPMEKMSSLSSHFMGIFGTQKPSILVTVFAPRKLGAMLSQEEYEDGDPGKDGLMTQMTKSDSGPQDLTY